MFSQKTRWIAALAFAVGVSGSLTTAALGQSTSSDERIVVELEDTQGNTWIYEDAFVGDWWDDPTFIAYLVQNGYMSAADAATLPGGQVQSPGVSPSQPVGQQPAVPTQPVSPAPSAGVPPSETGHHVALVIGINKYRSPGNDLNGCVKDAENFSGTILNDSRWEQANVKMMTDQRATMAAIRSEIYRMGEQTGPGDVVVYFQSSHGAQISGTNMSLVMHDTFYSDRDFGADLGQAFADGTTVIVIVDACHSGGLFKGAVASREMARAMNASFAANVMDAARQARAARNGTHRDKAAAPSIAFMTAADFDETSVENAMGGYFASAVCRAFSQRSADSNDDGKMSFLEIARWAGAEASEDNPEQNAQLFNEGLLGQTIASRLQGSGPDPDPVDPFFFLCGAMGISAPLMMMLGFAGLKAMPRRRRWAA